MERNGSGYMLSSGRRIYAYSGVIGLDPVEGPSGRITEGLDGRVNGYTENDEDDLLREDAIEIAEYMVEQWSQYLRELRKVR